MKIPAPTIKGIFVRQHLKSLKKVLGETGLDTLKKRYGKPLTFKNADNVPIEDEVHLLECIVDCIHPKKYSGKERQYMSGVYHFRNFSESPIARIVLFSYRMNFRKLVLHSKNIVAHIMHNLPFSAESLGPKKVKVVIGSAYPLEHFKGFIDEWLKYSKLKGRVETTAGTDSHTYIIEWK